MVNEMVKAARQRAGLTQADAAKVLGIARYAYILHEVHGHDLPRRMSPAEAIDKLNAVAAETQKAS